VLQNIASGLGGHLSQNELIGAILLQEFLKRESLNLLLWAFPKNERLSYCDGGDFILS
jgi:hypothetical protein